MMATLPTTSAANSSFGRGWSASNLFGASLVVLQLSALYGFVGMAARLPDAATFSIVTLGLHLIYCGLNIRAMISLLNRWYVLLLIVFIWLFPLLIILFQFTVGIYTIDRFIYWSAYVSFFGILTMTSLILSYRVDVRYINRLISISLVVIAIEFVVNKLSYDNVRPVLLFISSPVSASLSYSRILGFFSHPNEAACAVNLCLFWLLLWRDVRFGIGQLFLIGIAASLIIATGSRTSLMILVLIVAGYLYRTAFTEREGGGKVFFTIAAGIPILTIVIGFIMAQPSAQDGMLQRIAQLVSVVSGDGGVDDSAALRVTVIDKFVDIVLDAPLLGVGFDALRDYVERGVLPTVSQIAWLQWAGEYGIIYPMFGSFVFAAIYAHARRARHSGYMKRRAGSALSFLLVILFFYSLSLIDIFMVRSIVVVLALSVGTLARPIRGTYYKRDNIREITA